MRQLTSLFVIGTSLLGTSLLGSGCAKKADSASVDSADSAVDSSEGVEDEGNMMAASMDGADMSGLTALTSAQVAAAISANVALRWIPSTCASVTTSGADVTVTYNDCTGPRGLLHVTGELDLTVSVALDGTISVHATASDLKVNSAVLTIDADATYMISGTSRSLTVTTQGTGTGARGNEIDHNGSYTIGWDTADNCHTIAGSWSTDITTPVASATRSNLVDIMRCVPGCPDGSLTHHYLGGASVTVTFDGTATATWSASTGASGSVPLLCTP